jgi:hypothetical protein
MTERPARTWRYYVVSFVIMTPFILGVRTLLGGGRNTPMSWLDNLEYALVFTVPYLTLQALLERVRARRAAK